LLVNDKKEIRNVEMPSQSQPLWLQIKQSYEVETVFVTLNLLLSGRGKVGFCRNSEPTGKLFGLKKFDLIETVKGVGFVKGKRSTGFFAVSKLNGNMVSAGIDVKRICKRISARTTTLTERFENIFFV